VVFDPAQSWRGAGPLCAAQAARWQPLIASPTSTGNPRRMAAPTDLLPMQGRDHGEGPLPFAGKVCLPPTSYNRLPATSMVLGRADGLEGPRRMGSPRHPPGLGFGKPRNLPYCATCGRSAIRGSRYSFGPGRPNVPIQNAPARLAWGRDACGPLRWMRATSWSPNRALTALVALQFPGPLLSVP